MANFPQHRWATGPWIIKGNLSTIFWLCGLGEGVRVNPNIVRIAMHIDIYGRSLTQQPVQVATVLQCNRDPINTSLAGS